MNKSVTSCQCRQLSCASTSTECDILYKLITIYKCLSIIFYPGKNEYIKKHSEYFNIYIYHGPADNMHVRIKIY